MSKIKRLDSNKFRGVVQESLDLDGCSLVILGENGTGKSSFIDALEFYFTGRVGHLEGAQGISTTRHASHILAAQKETSVAVQFSKNDFVGLRTFDGLSEIPADLKDFHNQGANATFILRRKNLLDFILAQPGPRYEQLATIIGVEDLDKVERSLMQVCADTETEVSRVNDQVEGEEKKLSELIGETDFSDQRLLLALNQKLRELNQEPLGSLADTERIKLQMIKGSHSPEDLERALKLQDLADRCGALLEGMALFDLHSPFLKSIEKLHKDRSQVRDLLFEEVLKSSNRLISDYKDIEICPVCLKPMDRQELLQALEKRIQQLQPIAELAGSIKKLRDKFRDSIKEWMENFRITQELANQIGLTWDFSRIDSYRTQIEGLALLAKTEPADMNLEPFVNVKGGSEISEATKSLMDLKVAIQSEKARLEPTEEDKRAVQVIELITRVSDAHQALSDLRPELHAKQLTFQEITDIYETFVGTKRNEIQGVYGELQEDIRRFFAILHPDEGYQEVRLEVNEGKRASTEIKMDFHNRMQEDPRAFNSEGHLDSLGLCVFLAFVKRFNSDFPIIALDDVVSSIDSGHRQRVCDLLFDEFPEAQWFITTHDYIWYEELGAYQTAHDLGPRFKNLQILSWSIEEGPHLSIYKPRWALIDEKLAKGDKDGAAASIRKELEAFLLEATISLQARVPIKRDSKYTVGDLHDPLVAHFRKRVPDVFKGKEGVFKSLQVNGIFANLLTHNNPQAGNASIEEVRGLADAVRQFENVFVCPNCRTIVTYYKDAKIIRCKCKEKGLLWATKD